MQKSELLSHYDLKEYLKLVHTKLCLHTRYMTSASNTEVFTYRHESYCGSILCAFYPCPGISGHLGLLYTLCKEGDILNY